MIIPKNILKFWGVFFIILAVALGVITLIYRWHRIFPTHEVSEIYSRYAKEEGIDAAFVKDYRVNDSVTVDVTLLEATTDSAWVNLMNDFDLGKDSGTNSLNRIVAWRSPNGKPTEHAQPTSPDDWGVAAVPGKKYISIFHSKNEEEITAISFYIFQNILNTRP